MRTPDPWNIPKTPFRLAHVEPQGITARRLHTALVAERVVRLRRGVYIAADAVPEAVTEVHLLRALAEQVAVPELVATEGTAALGHGLPLLDADRAATGPTVFWRPGRSTLRSKGPNRGAGGRQTRIRLRSLPSHHVTRLPSGLVVTTVARTAVDLAVEMDPPEALMLLDAVLRAELSSIVGVIHRRHYADARLRTAAVRPLLEALDHLPQSRRRRLSPMIRLADLRRESPLESFSAGQFMLAGLPQPEHQVRIPTPFGDFFPDNLWRAQRLIGEADGQAKYTDQESVTAEKLRDGYLIDQGYGLLHWTGREMFGAPARVVDRVGGLLVGRGWDGCAQSWQPVDV